MKKKRESNKFVSGLSLIEILVVVLIFAVLGVMISASLILTINGTKKGESVIKVRENINYAFSIIERNLRNADRVVDCSESNNIVYVDQYGNQSSFSCVGIGSEDSFIASGSGLVRLTSSSVEITDCSFTCLQPADLSQSPIVTVDVSAKDAELSGAQSSGVNAQTKVYLRN